VERFLGFTNYHRAFIEEYTQMAFPLQALTGKRKCPSKSFPRTRISSRKARTTFQFKIQTQIRKNNGFLVLRKIEIKYLVQTTSEVVK
jgi:hypothetical protein